MGKIWAKKLIRSEESKRYWEKYVEENWEKIKKEHREEQKRRMLVEVVEETNKDITQIERDVDKRIEGRTAKELAGDKDFIDFLENAAKILAEEERGLSGTIYNSERLIPQYKDDLSEESLETAKINLIGAKRRLEYIETVKKRINKKIAGVLQEYNKEHNENYSSFTQFALDQFIRNRAEDEYTFFTCTYI